MMTEQQSRAVSELVRGRTQQEAAEAVGISRRTLVRWLAVEEFRAAVVNGKAAAMQALAVSDKVQSAEHEAVAVVERMRTVLERIVSQLGPALQSALKSGDLRDAAGLARELRGAASDALRAHGALGPEMVVTIDARTQIANLKAQIENEVTVMAKLVAIADELAECYPEQGKWLRAAIVSAFEGKPIPNLGKELQ